MLSKQVLKTQFNLQSQSDLSAPKFVVDYVANHEGQAGIIYCSTRKQVEELHEALNSEKLRAQFIMLV